MPFLRKEKKEKIRKKRERNILTKKEESIGVII